MHTRKNLTSGIILAEQSLAQKPDSESYAVLGSLYSIGTKVKTGTMISTGLKIQEATKKALKLNADNPIAVHLQAAGYVSRGRLADDRRYRKQTILA